MTNHEKALKTFQELQKRKAAKAKFQDGETKGFLQDTFYKCLRERGDLKTYR